MNELDEIEIQKGLLQIGKALQFLHESAKLVHSNLTTEAIVINAKVWCSDACVRAVYAKAELRWPFFNTG